ncbi:MAG: aldo/keto reductase [Candidatus Brocadiia bacterium]
MDYVNLGNSDLLVSRLCLGTWNMAGGKGWGPEDDKKSIELIRRTHDSGCNFFDSAHVYGRGHSEELLGEALAEGDRRERAVIGTKIMQRDQGKVEKRLDAALRRLQTDYLDLYTVHWPYPRLDLRAFMDEMAEMKQKGKVRELGVSNFDLAQMRVAAEYDAIALQPPYNVVWRGIEDDILPFCRQSGIGVTPYSPLGQGLLTGRFSRDSEEKSGIRQKNILFEEPIFSQAVEAAGVVDQVADELGCSSPQVALAWLLHTEGVTAPIVGVSSWSQWQEDLGALDLQLSDEQYERISAAGMEVWGAVPEDATMWGWKPE